MARKLGVKIMAAIALVAIAFLAGRYSSTQTVEYETIQNKSLILNYAEAYIGASPYSEKGLVNALVEYEQCDESAAQEVVSEMNIDWQEQANLELQKLLSSSGLSEKQVRDFMFRDLYTKKQIDKVIKSSKPDWSKQAEMCAAALSEAGISSLNIKTALLSRGFTLEQVN